VSDSLLYDILCVLTATLLVAFGLAYVVGRLKRMRPDLAVGTPLAVAVGIRLVATLGVAASGVGETLRGGDEITFLTQAHYIAQQPFDSDVWLPIDITHRLHEIVFALQFKLADFPEAALRVTQIGIAVLGTLLIVAAIHDVAGPRASRLGMWVLALEPASIFFNSILHREPLLVLASGLVVLGGAKIWAKLELHGVLMLGLGCAIAVATRPYAGWFLMTGGLLLILYASLRQVGRRLASIPLIYAVAIVVAVAAPAVLSLTSQDSLEQNLQGSQNANTAANLARGAAGSNNLSLERVDFSSRSDLITNLPQRIRDVLLRPYPWQTANTSQRLGAVGTLVAIAALILLWRYARRNRGQVLAVAAPFIFPAFFLLLAYALSVGNAGTGFRYRTHLVLLGLATLVVLREHALRRDSSKSDEEPQEDTVRPERAMGDVIRHSQPLVSGGRRE
jgi:hypothetical protein